MLRAHVLLLLLVWVCAEDLIKVKRNSSGGKPMPGAPWSEVELDFGPRFMRKAHKGLPRGNFTGGCPDMQA